MLAFSYFKLMDRIFNKDIYTPHIPQNLFNLSHSLYTALSTHQSSHLSHYSFYLLKYIHLYDVDVFPY